MKSELVLAIGDIHGRLDLLEPLLEFAETLSEERDVVVVTLGDYVDRGRNGKGVIDRLIAGPTSGKVRYVHICGNHDTWMLASVREPRGAHLRDWISFGGIETMLSYGMEDEEEMFDGRFVARVPESHITFLKRLKSFYATDTHLFVHAGLQPGIPLEDQDVDTMQWIRDEFLESDFDFGRVIVHGHTVRSRPQVRNNRIGIDTGAEQNDRLTAVILDGNESPQFVQCRQLELGGELSVTTVVDVDVVPTRTPTF